MASSNNKEKRVLLVEDARAAQLVATKMLQTYSFTVDVAENGSQGLELAMENLYDLIFMDVGLPEGQNFGFLATQKIRCAECINTHTIIIALTAHSSEDMINQSTQFGANCFLTKPLSMEKIESILLEFQLT